MTLKKTEIKKVLKTELGIFLKQYGYKFDSKQEGFVRYFPEGFNMFGFAIIDYSPKFQISAYFLIRINEVEKIVQKHVFVLEKYRDITYSINTNIEYFTHKREYEINTDVGLDDLINTVKDVYSSKVDTFLKHYSDIQNLNKAINHDRIPINGLIEPDNCIRSIIIARLANDPKFEEIAESYYEKYIGEYNLDIENGPKRIRETIEYLKTI